ncbi:ZC3H11A [Cordylochernes scorpioides]|uniref:ZC3H11A n=1 Tax=Cordylochernes scorpioides TaxID=51811 RepID=A0ABY6LJV1_9ARAC|nr:ZC3H11A [Cordylochernes scorpioides]
MNNNNCFPPSYEQATRQHASLTGDLSVMDFLPYCLNDGGIFSQPKYQPFRELMDRANHWLQNHSHLEVKTCESVEFKLGEDIESMTYLETCHGVNQFIRGLRLWLVPRLDPSRPPQYLKHLNLVPDPEETLDDVLLRFNQLMETVPLPGRILTVETQEMKVPSSGAFDPDKSNWSEMGNHERHFIFVLRIFFEYGPPAHEDLGVRDFVPHILNKELPFYETFSQLVKRASAWCSRQELLRVCHAQSVEIKIKDGVADSRKMSYTEHCMRNTHYLRILRIAFTQPSLQWSHELVSPPRLLLSCKTFFPSLGQDSMGCMASHVRAWVKAAKARVLSVETAAMRLYTGGEEALGPEASYTYNFYTQSEHWVFVIRVYMDGCYEDPFICVPPPILPEESNCCAIL